MSLSDYEYSILDEVRRDEINQALKLQELVKKKEQDYDDYSYVKNILKSLINESQKTVKEKGSGGTK